MNKYNNISLWGFTSLGELDFEGLAVEYYGIQSNKNIQIPRLVLAKKIKLQCCLDIREKRKKPPFYFGQCYMSGYKGEKQKATILFWPMLHEISCSC